MDELEVIVLKVAIIGDLSVGKTCTVVRYTEDHFSGNYINTIGERAVLP